MEKENGMPNWLSVGAWVTPVPGKRKAMKVADFEDDGRVFAVDTEGWPYIAPPTAFRPIRFRFPTLQEAYAWLGKVMAFKDGRRELVYLVEENGVEGDDMGTERMLFINGHPAECLELCTIDGHPFGVPEVDEEAMKEEVQE